MNPTRYPYLTQTSSRINQIGGVVHLGFSKSHTIPSSTQNQYTPMESVMMAKKTGTVSSFKTGMTQQERDEISKMKAYIQKDHISEDFAVDLGEKKSTDYRNHFNDDDKMK